MRLISATFEGVWTMPRLDDVSIKLMPCKHSGCRVQQMSIRGMESGVLEKTYQACKELSYSPKLYVFYQKNGLDASHRMSECCLRSLAVDLAGSALSATCKH